LSDAYAVGRRRVLQAFGLTAAAGSAAMFAADPVLGASLGHDERMGVNSGTYEVPTGLAKDSDAKKDALAWIDGHAGEVTALSDRIWQLAELSLLEWKSSLAVAELLRKYGFTIEWGAGGFPAAFVAT
jgi:aminobenzoyl-glutamate utilization protein B